MISKGVIMCGVFMHGGWGLEVQPHTKETVMYMNMFWCVQFVCKVHVVHIDECDTLLH